MFRDKTTGRARGDANSSSRVLIGSVEFTLSGDCEIAVEWIPFSPETTGDGINILTRGMRWQKHHPNDLPGHFRKLLLPMPINNPTMIRGPISCCYFRIQSWIPKRVGMVMSAIALIFAGNFKTSCCAAPEQINGSKPNILFLITDQQTIDAMSCAGNQYVKTPNIDRLAARGMRFERSYCTYPLCAPSRSSIFSSRFPHELGIYENLDAELSKKIPQSETMGELFKNAGYETAYAGKWHVLAPFPGIGPGGQNRIPGFTVLPVYALHPSKVDVKKHAKGLTVDPGITEAAIKFLQQKHDKPFLLVASILNPHDICEVPECADLQDLLPSDRTKLPPARPNVYDKSTLPSVLQNNWSNRDWPEEKWREYLWIYYRLVEIADAQLGEILDALDKAGLAANTVVVFTSDHGEMMGAHQMVTKQKLYEEAAAVPLIVAPLAGRAAVNSQQLVSGLDIMPTLLDYAGIAPPAAARGRSLRALVDGKEIPWREFVVSETNWFCEARMIRTSRYKYIVYQNGNNREQFFDLEKDPGELKNLIDDRSLSMEVVRHRGLLEQWRQDTNDVPGKGGDSTKDSKKSRVNAAPQEAP